MDACDQRGREEIWIETVGTVALRRGMKEACGERCKPERLEHAIEATESNRTYKDTKHNRDGDAVSR